MNHVGSCSILLFYKGKILLLSPDLPTNGVPQHLWSLIGGKNIDAQSPEQAIQRKIKYITKLELERVYPLSPSSNKSGRHFYHCKLTDHDVNSMERREGQRLEFFTLVELEKLTLTESTATFLAEYKNTVKELLA